MSHHLPIIHQEIRIGHIVVTNNHQVLSVVIHQPWGEIEILRSQYPEVKEMNPCTRCPTGECACTCIIFNDKCYCNCILEGEE